MNLLTNRPATVARICGAVAAGLLVAAMPAAIHAQTVPPAQNLLRLSAHAHAEVTQDWLSVTLAASRDGNEGAAVQQQLKQVLDTALADARRAAKPGQIEVRTGGFSLHPRYSQKGTINGWTGRAELLLEGRDAQGIAALAARIKDMPVAGMGFGLSREAREKAESELAAQAVARFRARADELARLFGFSGYTIRDVEVGGADAPRPQAVPMMRARATAALSDEPIPVEAGKTTVTLTINGQVQMTR